MNKTKWKRTFITIYTGQAFSLLGSSAVQFAVIWWLTAYTESAVTLTLATVISFLPNMLLGSFVVFSIFVDFLLHIGKHHNKRNVLILVSLL